ncbi:MAG TPA: exodeoxyribonuclease VII small subunit [candidate division Zixibacteria bacterium]|nr:exodeoxyribonuclease VII small subunit [candidate division Zixibacteria bacterium]
MNDKEPKELTFEAALYELEETVTKLESGELALEETLQLFEKGQSLAVLCSSQLESAAMRVEMLTSDGEILDISAE